MNIQIEKSDKVRKIVMFTDAHFGCRNNSELHNQDNLDYLDWLMKVIKREEPTHLVFLGDWYENRAAINVLTLKYSLEGLRRLNALGLPIWFIVGNHDLYHRHTREVHSVDKFGDLNNVRVVDSPLSINDEFLFLPYLFRHEYPLITPVVNQHPYIFGHLEFRNFILTGDSRLAEHGPDHKLFKTCKHIFSGHYHKRQANDNVIYIGNTFPTNYGDAGDLERGCCVFNVEDNEVDFYDWPGCPSFVKVPLSHLMDGLVVPNPKARVKCMLDLDLSYSDAQFLREGLMEEYGLREFIIEENVNERREALEEGINDLEEFDLTALDVTVRKLLETGVPTTTAINPHTLIEEYDTL